MKLTQVTVSYGETQSLPEYSNVKPQITLTAMLDEGDDPHGVELYLWEQAKATVHAQIDLALEANGKAAKHDPCERYQLFKTYHDPYYDRGAAEPPKLIVIVPDSLDLKKHFDWPRFVHAAYPESRRLRSHHALRLAAEEAQELGGPVIDCSSGDLAPLHAALPSNTAPEHLEDTLDHTEQRSDEAIGDQVDQLVAADETEEQPE